MSDSASAAQRVLADRILARRRLLHFTRLTHPRYIAGWVHDDICRRLERFSRQVEEGLSPRLMLLMPPRHGKQLSHDTPVWTTRGMRRHGDLAPGDEIWHPSGQTTTVVAVSEEAPQDCEMVFSNGAVVECHENHEWVFTATRQRGIHYDWRRFSTKQVEAMLASPEPPRLYPPVPSLPPNDPAPGDEVIGISASALGSWLRLGDNRRAPERLQEPLRKLGLLDCPAADMRVPPVCFELNATFRRALLESLADPDTRASPKPGASAHAKTRYARKVHQQLVEDIERLGRSVGANIAKTLPKMRGGRRDARPKDGSATLFWTYTSGHPYVVAVRRVPPVMGRCIQVKHKDGLYVVTPYAIVTHNSELASIRFPAWHLGHYPHHEIINVGYNLDLPMGFSRKVREIFRDPMFEAIFPGAQLVPDSQSVEKWNTTAGGGFTAAGRGGGITGKGAHCFPAGTLVQTPAGAVRIEHITPSHLVLAYDHKAQRPVWRSVRATNVSQRSDLVRITTAAGRRFVSTADHRVFVVGQGYTQAQLLAAGDSLIVADMPTVRGAEAVGVEGLPPVLRPSTQRTGAPDVRAVLEGVHTRGVGGGEGSQERVPESILFEGVQSIARGGAQQEVPDVSRASHGARQVSECAVLLARVSSGSAPGADQALLAMRAGVQSGIVKTDVLFQELRCAGAQSADDWHGEFPPPVGDERTPVGQRDAPADSRARSAQVRGVQLGAEAAHAPHRRGPGEQPSEEPHHAVQQMPSEPPPPGQDTVSLVERAGSSSVTVYDIDVEGEHNFFANEVLVHNCLLVDDPIKDQDEADSALVRDKLWDWFQSTAYTRLAPGGGVLIIQTWWSDDDLAGRLQSAMAQIGKEGAPEGIDAYEVIRYPALSTEYEYRDDYDPDSPGEIIRSATPIDVADPPLGMSRHLKLLRPPDMCLHEGRYPTAALKRIRANLQPRIWSALYQQNPVPDEGMYFRKDIFVFHTEMPSTQGMNVYTAWDFAIGEKTHNDWTVGATVAQGPDDMLYVLDIHRMKGDSLQIVEAMLDVAQRWGSGLQAGYLVGAEDGQIWRALEPLLKKRMLERRQYLSIEVLKPLTDKMARARPLQGRMQQGRVAFPANAPWLAQAQHELLRFPAGVHDDVVDALAWAAHLVLGHEAPRAPATPHTLPSWRDRLLGSLRLSGSHMAS